METIKEKTEAKNSLLNELRAKIKPSVYCYSGSGMLTNEYSDEVAEMMVDAIIKVVEPHIQSCQDFNYKESRIEFDKLKKELGTENWTAKEHGLFYAFFLHGWNKRENNQTK